MDAMEGKKPKLYVLLIWFVVFILLAVWLGTAVGADDFLWFLPVFQARPAYVDLYWDGQYTRLLPGDPGYDLCYEALVAEFPHIQSYPPGVGLSDESLELLRQEGRLLEAYFEEPALIHTRYHFSASRVYYVPLSGHHVRENRVFNGGRGSPLELASLHRILAAAESAAQQRNLQ
jgi:hypothetical protein